MNRGFSLLELLVVVAIVGALAAAGVVGYQNYAREAKVKTGSYNMNTVFRYMLNIRQQIPLAGSLDGQCELKIADECIGTDGDPIQFLNSFRTKVMSEFGFENPIFPDCPISLMHYIGDNPETSVSDQYGIVLNATDWATMASASSASIPPECRLQTDINGIEYVQGAIYFQLLASSGANALEYFGANMYMPCEAVAQGETECL